MILNLGDWVLDVDIRATMEYAAQEVEQHCTCAYCQNFYAAVDREYPEIRGLLGSFGAAVEAPEELMPYDMDGRMVYDATWALCGSVVRMGSRVVEAAGCRLAIDPDNRLQINSDCPEPRIFLNIPGLDLPWILDEPMEEVVSPANVPSFLRKMWARLLGSSRDNTAAQN